jgi:hypothetical protein
MVCVMRCCRPVSQVRTAVMFASMPAPFSP